MIDLSTQEKKDAAIASFKSLKLHPGWILFEMIQQENMEVIKNRILVGAKDETIHDVETLRKVLSLHKEMIDTPDTMIKNLGEQVVQKMPNDDPFE